LTPGFIIQPKLVVGRAGDKYEQEADRVAQQIMHTAAPPIQRQIAPLGADAEKAQAKMFVRGLGNGEGFETGNGTERKINQQRSNGSPLPGEVRAFMEPRFGADFSQVRVHTNRETDQLNRSLSARAFTTGQHIFFKRGEYNPGTHNGQVLLAHELTHVVQQRSSNHAKPEANPINVIQRWPDVQGPEDILIWIAVIIGIIVLALGVKRYRARNRIIRAAQADPDVQAQTLRLVSGSHGDEAKVEESARRDSGLEKAVSILIRENDAEDSSDGDELAATLATPPARPLASAGGTTVTPTPPTMASATPGLTMQLPTITGTSPALGPALTSSAATQAAASAAAGGSMSKMATLAASESKSKAEAEEYGQEMARLGGASDEGRFQFHYGINPPYSSGSGLPTDEYGVRTEAMAKYGGTVGEFSFHQDREAYRRAQLVDYKLINFVEPFNRSIVPSGPKAARYTGADENKSGEVTKFFAHSKASRLAPTIIGRRFSKASMVYAVMSGGHIHFHLEGMGNDVAVADIVSKKGTHKDAVTSSELRYVNRYWNRGFSIFLPPNFFSDGYGSDSDDGGSASLERNDFKGFKGHVSFYRKMPGTQKYVTVPPPWKA
jgi:hypothetical protein